MKINDELLESELVTTTTNEYVTLKLRIEAEMTGDPESVHATAPLLSSALVTLLYQDLAQSRGKHDG